MSAHDEAIAMMGSNEGLHPQEQDLAEYAASYLRVSRSVARDSHHSFFVSGVAVALSALVRAIRERGLA